MPDAAVVLHDAGYALRAATPDGRGIDNDVFVDVNNRLKFGAVVAPDVLTKTVRIPAHFGVMADDTEDWVATTVQVRPRTAGNQITWYAPVVLPEGATITAVRARSYRETTSDEAVAQLHRVASDASTLLATLTHSTTGWQTTVASIDEDVQAGAHYVLKMTLLGLSAAADARWQWWELDYDVPDYATGI